MAGRPRLYDLLKTFSKEEFLECRRYVQYRLDEGSQLMRLATFIFKDQESLPCLATMQKEIFGAYTKKAISNKISILKSHVESFLIQNYQDDRKVISQCNLFLAYHERGLYKEAQRQRKKVEKFCNEHLDVDLDCHMILHKIKHHLFFSHTTDKDEKGLRLLQDSSHYLHTYQYLKKIQYQIESNVREEYFMDSPFHQPKTESPKDKGILIKVLLDLKSLIDEKSRNTNYNLILDYVNAGTAKHTGEIYTFIILHFIHFKIHLLKIKNIAVDEDLLHLYDCGLKTGAFMQKKYLSSRRFNNIINAGCAFQRLEWAKRVLKEYKNDLSPKEKKEAVLMAQSQILQAQGQYKRALDILGPNQWTSLDNKLRLRWLTAICLLEINSVYRLDSHLTAFTNYLKSPGKKLTKPTIEASLNFVKIVRMLRRNIAVDKIRSSYRDMDLVSNRSWIEQKLKGPSQK